MFKITDEWSENFERPKKYYTVLLDDSRYADVCCYIDDSGKPYGYIMDNQDGTQIYDRFGNTFPNKVMEENTIITHVLSLFAKSVKKSA